MSSRKVREVSSTSDDFWGFLGEINMSKIIDLKEAERNKKSRIHTLEHFIQTEFTRDNANISVKPIKYRGGLVEARIIAGKGFGAREVIKVNFDDDIEDVRIESIDVLYRLYQYLAIRVAEKYEQVLGQGREVNIYIT